MHDKWTENLLRRLWHNTALFWAHMIKTKWVYRIMNHLLSVFSLSLSVLSVDRFTGYSFFKKELENISLFGGVIDAPCFGLLGTSTLGFKARMDCLAYVFCRLWLMDSSDSLWCDTCWPLGCYWLQFWNRIFNICGKMNHGCLWMHIKFYLNMFSCF